ncbi:MAG: hypothetical protein ACHQUC_06540 [Chlamydiales bacterium]
MNIINQIITEIHTLSMEYQTKIEKREAVDETSEKISTVMNSRLPEIREYFAAHAATPQDLDALILLKKELEPLDTAISKIGIAQLNQIIEQISPPGSEALKAFQSRIENLSEEPEISDEEFILIPEKDLKQAIEAGTVDTPQLADVIDGKHHFDEVLKELNRLKGELGGSPVFGRSVPTIDERDNAITIFGKSKANLKDFFRMVLEVHWKPAFFWKMAARLFGVTGPQYSQYEAAHIHIQRFGMAVANKTRFFEIIDRWEEDRFIEFDRITGLNWHPIKNPGSIEKNNIELVESFLTEYFEEAKKKGDEALKAYFMAFNGVCFEGRIRNFDEYMNAYPLEALAGEMKGVSNIVDVNTEEPVKRAFDKIMSDLGPKLQELHEELTPLRFLEEVRKYEVFDKEFPKGETKAKPTLEDAHQYVLDSIDLYVMDPYSSEDFLEMEFQIFESSEGEQTEAKFLEKLQQRDGGNGGTFSVSSPEVREFIQNKFPQ